MQTLTFADSIGTTHWLGAMPGDLPPCLAAVYYALAQSPNGPHRTEAVAARAGLAVPATEWALWALGAADIIGERHTHDYVCFAPVNA